MKKLHLTFERVIEATTGEKPLNSLEKDHVDSCSLCQGRIKAAESTDEALSNSKKAVSFIDSNKIMDIADKVFDQETSKQSLSIYKILAVAASFVLILAVFAFSGGFFSSETEKPVKKTAEMEKKEKKQKKQKESVLKKADRLPIGVMKIAEGSVFQGERCELRALAESKITVESENYFIVEKGRVEFSVTKGENFMVKLNGSALVRVLGTVFTVEVKGKVSSVEVSEGLVEMIDLDRGTSQHLSKGESGTVKSLVRKKIRTASVKVRPVKNIVVKKIAEVKAPLEKVEKKKKPAKFKFSNDPEMLQAEIADLETSLKFSDTPLVELHQLFKLYTKSSRFGSILNYWRSKGSIIRSKNNLNLKEMHYSACKASIELNVYNKICGEFKESYPDGPFPSGMEYHLKMTQ